MISRTLPNGTVEIDLSMENLSIDRKINVIKRLLEGDVIIENVGKKQDWMDRCKLEVKFNERFIYNEIIS